MIRRALLVLLALLGLGLASGPALAQFGAPEPTGPQTGLRVEPLTIVTARGARSFQVEIAETPEQREIGMMFRMSVARGHGMLFDFRTPQDTAFWMKNTLIPLDIIYIRADGTIANIAANATPLSLQALPSAGPVRGVLEIGGGEAARLGIRPGQRVLHRIFPAPPRRARPG